ncbi:MAG: 50S ribosomal protein L21 [Chlamydiota bacterium]
MYAIIQSGSKQYRVKKGDRISIDLLDQSEGTITFSGEDVLFLYDGHSYITGLPGIANATVTAKILGPVQGPKVVSFRYRRRKDSKRTVGHRQQYQEIEIEDIQL